MRYAHIDRVSAGNVVALPIIDIKGKIIVNANVVLTAFIIDRLKVLGYTGMYIYDNLSKDIEFKQNVDLLTKMEAAESVHNKDFDQCMYIAQYMVSELLANGSDIYTSMETIGSYDAGTYLHSINVATYSGILGMLIGLSAEKMKQLVVTAMLHDIGKTLIDEDIINKQGKLTAEEFEIVKTHPRLGYDLLKENESVPSVVRVSILEHHENADGSGYPIGLKDDDIYLFAKIIHICDVYDAMISKRPYKKEINPADVLEHLMAQAGTMFNYGLAVTFVKNVIPYPEGVLVELSNGKLCVVKQNIKGYALRPVVIEVDTGIEHNLLTELSLTIVKICI